MAGYNWLQLADALTTANEMLLPRAIVRGWTVRLMDECMRSVGAAYHSRLEALSTLAADDRFALYVLDAARELTEVPGASGAKEAWCVVGDIRSPEVIDALVRELGTVPDDRFDDISMAVAMPAHLGALTSAQENAIAGDHRYGGMGEWEAVRQPQGTGAVTVPVPPGSHHVETRTNKGRSNTTTVSVTPGNQANVSVAVGKLAGTPKFS
ncbi:hypothetical protein [Luteipulveratus halotolerans]|uniref:Uncharacterized protein n=1 Tax=Luteipulveratus halotolerans TaxID=1631356 RepID=A0A0L6CGQ3_9MICO|nr:hypothetical protein [Luteipulveratus halotolerans]KNX36976.1 hypothetical protein VV01_07140 [Luteipulveratus halotolerans]